MTRNLEIELIERICQGDLQAENELFQRYNQQIRYMVYNRLRMKLSSEDIEDLVGEIQAAALTSLRNGGYDPEKGSSVGAYLVGITVRVISQYFRNQKKDQTIETEMQAMDHPNPNNALDDLVTREHEDRVRAGLSRLDDKYREVLLLRFYQHYSIEEIAQELNMERRRVSERIHYALKKLIKELKRDKYFSI